MALPVPNPLCVLLHQRTRKGGTRRELASLGLCWVWLPQRTRRGGRNVNRPLLVAGCGCPSRPRGEGMNWPPEPPVLSVCCGARRPGGGGRAGMKRPLLVFARCVCPSGPRGARVTLASLGPLEVGRDTRYGRPLLFLREREGPILRWVGSASPVSLGTGGA